MSKPLLFSESRHVRFIKRAENNFEKHNFLFQKSAQSLIERLSFIKRNFQNILLIDNRNDGLLTTLKERYPTASICFNVAQSSTQYDCIINNLSLHWKNDIPGFLRTVHGQLKPDGVFVASLFGDETLLALRHCFLETESTLYNSVTPHISPAIDIKTLGALMQQAGFDEPVMDCENYTVLHKSLVSLFHDLRGMGENNALNSPARMITRKFLHALEKNYAEKTLQNDGFLETRFDVLYAIGWKHKEP